MFCSTFQEHSDEHRTDIKEFSLKSSFQKLVRSREQHSDNITVTNTIFFQRRWAAQCNPELCSSKIIKSQKKFRYIYWKCLHLALFLICTVSVQFLSQHSTLSHMDLCEYTLYAVTREEQPNTPFTRTLFAIETCLLRVMLCDEKIY